MSGTKQYLRKASLIIGDDKDALDLSELRFRFYIRRGDTQTPNTADIRVYNLAPDTALKIKKEFTRVVLQAGYDGNFGLIFDGNIKQIRRGRESPTDTYIDITAGDGDEAYNYSAVALSLAAGQTSPRNAIEQIIKGMAVHGASKGHIPDSLPETPTYRGEVFYGTAKDQLRYLARTTDSAWSIQDGKVDFIPLTGAKPSAEIPVITSATGMVGLPEQTQNGIKLRTLLNSNLKIGQVVQIDNASIQRMRYSLNALQYAENVNAALSHKLNDDGFYYVMVAEHYGDTRGNDWYTDLICLAVDATKMKLDRTATFPLNENVVGGANKFTDIVKRFP